MIRNVMYGSNFIAFVFVVALTLQRKRGHLVVVTAMLAECCIGIGWW
jgi:hypothetical protein